MSNEEFLIVAKPRFEPNSSGGSDLSIVDVWFVPDDKQKTPLAADCKPGSPATSDYSGNFDRYSFYRSRQPLVPVPVQHMVMYRTPSGWQMMNAPASVPPYLPDGRTLSAGNLPPYARVAPSDPRGFNPEYPSPNYQREYYPPMSSTYRDSTLDALDRARLVQEMRRQQMQDLQSRIYGPRQTFVRPDARSDDPRYQLPRHGPDGRTIDPRAFPPGYRPDTRTIDPRLLPPNYRVDSRTVDPRTIQPGYAPDARTIDPRTMPGYRTTVPEYRTPPGTRVPPPNERAALPDSRPVTPPGYRPSGPNPSYEPEPTLTRPPDFNRPVYDNPPPYQSRARYGIDPAIAARIAGRDQDLRRTVIGNEYERWARTPGGANYRVDPRAGGGDFDLQRTIMELGRGRTDTRLPAGPRPPALDPRGGAIDPRGGAIDPRGGALDPSAGADPRAGVPIPGRPTDDSTAWTPDPKNLRNFKDRLDFDPTGKKVPESVGEYLKRYGPPARPGSSGSRPPGPNGLPSPDAPQPSTMRNILGGVKDFLWGNDE
ncbi:MAG: hypothetical protein K2X93_02005 [Candidatus Obscuribacterales bacterium]|nr:hypothetical protein [Candidatus Obscuribacterales bacterium]